MLQLSQRGQAMPPSPFRKLTPYAEAAKRAGKKVFHLNIGQPDVTLAPELLEAVHRADFSNLTYSQAAGHDSYRHKLAGYYERAGIPAAFDDILVTTAGSEAILFALLTCLNPGDEIIVPEPFYGAYTAFAIAAGVTITTVTAHVETGYSLPPLADFKRVLTARTKAVLLCNPSNPTGYVYQEEELTSLLSFCREHDLYLLSDEAYREFCYDDHQAISALSLPGGEAHVVLLDTISKRYNVCGARIGALVTRNPAVWRAAFHFAQMRISPPGLGMLLAEAAANLPATYFDTTRAEYEARRDLTVHRLQAMPGVVCVVPHGAFYVMPQLPIDDAETFCQWLLEDFSHQGQTVMLSPARGFYKTPGLGRQQVRLAYVLNQNDLNEALDCLTHALQVYPGRQQPAAAVAFATAETI